MKPFENVPGQVAPAPTASRLVNVVAPLLLALQLLETVLLYPSLPDTVPSHWNAVGQVDSYSSKLVYVSIMPAISIGLYIFLRLIFAAINSGVSGQKPEQVRLGRNILTAVILGQQALFLIIQTILLLIAMHAGKSPAY